jgi:D-amino peptidase
VTRVFVSIDMEGVAGVAHLQQVWRGSDDYPACRMLMTREANAAVAGAFEGGATQVLVNDSHGDMYNLLPEEMDPRADLLIGSPKVPHSMMQGFGSGFHVVLFIGYHAGAGTQAAVLDHTYAGRILYEVRVNGDPWPEAALNAALAGVQDTPAGLITGDDKACDQAAAWIPGIRTVQVKQGFGRGVAMGMHPERARAAIREAAAEVVRGVAELRAFKPPGPFELEADLVNTGVADLCSLPPGVERIAARTVRYTSERFEEVFRCLLAWTYLGASEAPRYAGT